MSVELQLDSDVSPGHVLETATLSVTDKVDWALQDRKVVGSIPA